MATYELDEVLASAEPSKKTYSLDEVMGTSKPSLSRTDRFLKGVRDPIDASAQLLANIAPKGVENAINLANNYLSDKTGLVSRLPQGGLNQQLSEQESQYQAGRGSEANSFDAYRLGGNVLSPTNLAIAAKIPVGATAAQKALSAIGGGAAINVASQPVTDPNADFGTEKAKQGVIGAGASLLGQGVSSAVGRVISPRASTNPQIQMLRTEGVQPTIGQTLGGGFNRAEEALSSVPVLGSFVSGARTRANEQFQKGALNKALKPIGAQLPKGIQGRDALVFTENALKTKYDDVLNKIGAVIPDEQYTAKIANLEDMVNKVKMPNDKKLEFFSVLDTIKQSRDENGVMTSQAYKDLESELGRVASDLNRSTNVFDRKIAPAVKQTQQELRDMLQRQAGDNAKELQATNKAWANFKQPQRAMAALGAEEGNFTPNQLLNAIKAGDRSKDKGAFARGSALNQKYAEAGKTVLGNKVRDSGTPERLLLTGAGLGAGAISPLVAGGVLGGSLAYTPWAQRALTSAVSSRPQLAQPVANFIGNNSKYLLPAFGAMGTGLLNQ